LESGAELTALAAARIEVDLAGVAGHAGYSTSAFGQLPKPAEVEAAARADRELQGARELLVRGDRCATGELLDEVGHTRAARSEPDAALWVRRGLRGLEGLSLAGAAHAGQVGAADTPGRRTARSALVAGRGVADACDAREAGGAVPARYAPAGR